nr:MAG TPA: hypothetical protein [Caudoviricetes sp.]
MTRLLIDRIELMLENLEQVILRDRLLMFFTEELMVWL